MEKKRILIIDDESTFTRMVRLNLEKTGRFEVREENAAANGLKAARDFKPHLILLDVLMPTLDGGDVKAQIRRNRNLKTVPILFLTATISANEAGNRGPAGSDGLFISKPVSAERLIQLIDENLPPEETQLPPVV